MEVGLGHLASVEIARQARDLNGEQSRRLRALNEAKAEQRVVDQERLTAEQRLDAETAREARAIQGKREDARYEQDQRRRQARINRDVDDRRVDDRVFRRDRALDAAFDRRQVFEDDAPPPLRPFEAPPAADNAPPAQSIEVRQQEQLAQLRARDRRVAERTANEVALARDQARDLARSEVRIGALTQPDAAAPRGSVLDVQA